MRTTVLNREDFDLLVLSPGPGRPEDFGIWQDASIPRLSKKLPVFGVCLGVQAIGEYFGGVLGQLAQPAHGRPSRVQVRGGKLMNSLPNEIVIGRYHSLFVERDSMPDVLHRDGLHRGRCRHGHRTQDAAGRRRAVSSGIADVAWRRGRLTYRRKRISVGAARRN